MPENKNNEFIKEEFQSTSKIKKDYKVNPFEKYSGKFSTSFGTLILGMMLGVIGLVLLGYSEGIDNDLNTIRRTPLINQENLIRSSGMIKLTGKPTVNSELNVPNFEDDLIYYETITEEKIDGEWVEINQQQVFASFFIGEIKIDAAKADLEFDVMEISKDETEDKRVTISGVLAKNDLVVVGTLKDDVMTEGSVFVVTNKSNKDLIGSMSHTGTLEWWLYKMGALLLITLGITSFVLPILTFLDIFPKLSLGVLGLIFLFAFLLAALLVFIAAIVITFWWLIFVIVGLLVILLIRIKSKKKYQPISFVP